jgi:hypothetical protein
MIFKYFHFVGNGILWKREWKTSPGVENMKTGPDDFGTAENESGSAKHENETQRPL